MSVLGSPVSPGSSSLLPSVAQIQKAVPGRIGDEKDASAVAAVTAVRTAPGNKFFTAEGNRTITAPSAFNLEPDLVNKNLRCTP